MIYRRRKGLSFKERQCINVVFLQRHIFVSTYVLTYPSAELYGKAGNLEHLPTAEHSNETTPIGKSFSET